MMIHGGFMVFFYDGFYDGAVTVMSWLGKNRGASEWYTTYNMYHH